MTFFFRAIVWLISSICGWWIASAVERFVKRWRERRLSRKWVWTRTGYERSKLP
jgi:hypothetical protein